MKAAKDFLTGNITEEEDTEEHGIITFKKQEEEPLKPIEIVDKTPKVEINPTSEDTKDLFGSAYSVTDEEIKEMTDAE